jgi:hypothetical protein
LLREIEAPFYMAVTLVEQGEWLASQQRGLEAEPFLTEARGIFERLDATPWVERVDRVAHARVTEAAES